MKKGLLFILACGLGLMLPVLATAEPVPAASPKAIKKCVARLEAARVKLAKHIPTFKEQKVSVVGTNINLLWMAMKSGTRVHKLHIRLSVGDGPQEARPWGYFVPDSEGEWTHPGRFYYLDEKGKKRLYDGKRKKRGALGLGDFSVTRTENVFASVGASWVPVKIAARFIAIARPAVEDCQRAFAK